MIRALSFAMLVCGVSACNLYWPSSTSQPDPPDACCNGWQGDDDAPRPSNSCPFGEGPDPVACYTPGAGCELETWEHGCSCTCGSDGWWSCMPETVGSTCPTDPPPDGAIVPGMCSNIEAESLAQHGDWTLISGNSLSDGQGLTASSGSGQLVFQFYGTGLTMNVEEGYYDGTVAIAIDGAAPITESLTIPATAPSYGTQTVTLTLADGIHTAVVTCPTLACSIDYFTIPCAD